MLRTHLDRIEAAPALLASAEAIALLDLPLARDDAGALAGTAHANKRVAQLWAAASRVGAWLRARLRLGLARLGLGSGPTLLGLARLSSSQRVVRSAHPNPCVVPHAGCFTRWWSSVCRLRPRMASRRC